MSALRSGASALGGYLPTPVKHRLSVVARRVGVLPPLPAKPAKPRKGAKARKAAAAQPGTKAPRPPRGGAAPAAPTAGTPTAPAPQEQLLRTLERGGTLDEAVLGEVRALSDASLLHRAQSLAIALAADERTRELGRLASGVIAFRRGLPEYAWEELRGLPREVWARSAPAEYVRAGLATAPDTALAEVRALVAEDPPGVGPEQWFELLTAAFGAGEHDLARDTYAVLERHAGDDPTWRDAERQLRWLRPWVEADPASPSTPRPADGRPVFAVMDYGHPGAARASSNIGDHVQSIASLGHLVRHRGVRLSGPEPLVELLELLGERVRPELQRTDVDADLEVMTIHRDASTYEPIPEGTWVLCFGWFMHALFRVRHDFPLHRNLRPVFVSFHCSQRELMTADAVAYLKRYGPVGCRDWTTVYLLLSAGVPAFFSGCLTTTTNTLFPDLDAPPSGDAPVAYVDWQGPVPKDGVRYQHSSRSVRTRPFIANVREAVRLLDTYRRDHRQVLTSRLHCYLPLRSMGANVEFRPKNPSDIRFDGLIGIDDQAFDAIRQGLLGKLEQVFGAVLGGRSEDEVYALWRELTAADVAAAEARLREPAVPAPAPPGFEAAVRAAAESTVSHTGTRAGDDAEAVHCAVLVPPGAERSLAVLAHSLVEHASRPVHLWAVLLSPETTPDPDLVARLPGLRVSWVRADGLAREVGTPDGRGAAAASVARLALPDLLPGVDRLVVLPLPAVATADITALAGLDLGEHAVAAPRRTGTTSVSGFALVHRAASRMGTRVRLAAELRRAAHARHAYDFDAFSPDVLVMDLARLRREGFVAEALGLVQVFGLQDTEVLHVLLGAGRADVPPAWAAVPTRTTRRDPGLLHWADRVRPWDPELTAERDAWLRHDAALRAAATAS